MEYSPDSKAEAPSTFPSKSSYTAQLADKVRQQARQLQTLEDYKVLCEKLILKLSPGCPLPVVEECLETLPGTVSSEGLVRQVNELRRVLAQREQELGRVRSLSEQCQAPLKKSFMEAQVVIERLENDKKALEDSLRAEIFHSEEQRNYIQILKELLESNPNFSLLLQRAANNQPFDLLVQLLNANKQCEHYRKDIANYESMAAEERAKSEKCGEKVAEMEGKVEEVGKCLEDAVKALEEEREKSGKLEEEKNTILDYVEELTAKHDQLSADMENLNVLHTKVAEEKMISDKTVEALEQQLKDAKDSLNSQLDRNNARVESYRKQLESCKRQVQTLRDKCEEKAAKVADALESLNIYKELGETQEEALRNALDQLQDIKCSNQAQVLKSKEELELTMSERIKEIEDETTVMKQKNKELAEDLKKAFEENEKLAKDNNNLQQNYAAMSVTLNDIQNELELTKKELSNLYKEKREIESKLQTFTKKRTLSHNRYNLEPENETLHAMRESMANKELSSDVYRMKHREISEEQKGSKSTSNELHELKSNVYNCLSLISIFSKCFNVSQNERLKIAAEEFELVKLEDAGRSLEEFLKIMIEEYKAMLQTTNLLKAEKELVAEQLSELEVRYKSLLAENGSLTQREDYIKSELDILLDHKHKIEAEKKDYYKRCLELESENQQLSIEREKAQGDIERLESRIKQISILKERHTLNYRHKTLAADQGNQVTAKDKLELLSNERNDLETVLSKVCDALPSGELRKTVSDLIRTQLNIHGIGREKCEMIVKLNQTESLLRSQISTPRAEYVTVGIQVRKEVERLREELLNCEEQMACHKERLESLEAELEKLAARENRKAEVFLDNEKLLKQRRDRIEELEREAASMRHELKNAGETRAFTERHRDSENVPSNCEAHAKATLKERLMKVKSSFAAH